MQTPPLILLAGDCTGSAYLFAPTPGGTSMMKTGALPPYQLAFEVECGATVSILYVISD